MNKTDEVMSDNIDDVPNDALNKINKYKLNISDVHEDKKKVHEYIKNRFYSSNENASCITPKENIPENLLYVKEQSDILEHLQNNLVNRKKVDKIIPKRNIIDEK